MMLRFVIQCHSQADGDQHWDLMLEGPRGLYTWSLPAPPDDPQALPMTVQQLPDHRPMYLDYEGLVSNGRGRVDIHDSGHFNWQAQEVSSGVGADDAAAAQTAAATQTVAAAQTGTQAALPAAPGPLTTGPAGDDQPAATPPAPLRDPQIADELTFQLHGRRIKGQYRLTRETQSGKDIWRLSKP